MNRSAQLRGACAFAAVLTLQAVSPPRRAHSQVAPTPATPSNTEDPQLQQARELNRQGLALLEAGDTERALSYFEDSRALYPSAKNTANVAICLDRLTRYDEALLMYEDLLVRFADGLDGDDRAAIGPAMAKLREHVGAMFVVTSSRGELFVDGRWRAVLPMKGSIRLNAGKHSVRIVEDGFAPFEREVTIEVERNAVVNATLEKLVGAGRLRVETPGAESAEVLVDGERMGTTPWEGSVATGPHLLVTRGKGLGSQPATVTIVEGQTVLLRPPLLALGAPVRISVEPRTAVLEIDQVRIPGSAWDGPLPRGGHRFTASEPGYVTKRHDVVVGDGAQIELTLRLELDPTHPRWPRPPGGAAWLGAVAAYAGGPTLGSRIEETCPDRCDGDPWAHGFTVAARSGYRFPFGMALELQGGFFETTMQLSRTASDDFALSPDGRIEYALDDVLRVQGPLFAAGISYRRDLIGPLTFEARGTAGVLITFSSDPITGQATTPLGSTDILLSDRNESLPAAAPLLWPSAALGLKAGPVDIGAGAGAFIVLTNGPSFPRRDFGARPDLDGGDPGAPGNSPLSDAISDERAYAPFVLFVPEIRASVNL